MTSHSTAHKPFFSEQIEKIDDITRAYLQKFQDGWLDRLLKDWSEVYFLWQSEVIELAKKKYGNDVKDIIITDRIVFWGVLKARIEAIIEYLTNPRKKNDWNEVALMQKWWERYGWLLKGEKAPAIENQGGSGFNKIVKTTIARVDSLMSKIR